MGGCWGGWVVVGWLVGWLGFCWGWVVVGVVGCWGWSLVVCHEWLVGWLVVGAVF